MKKYLLIIMAAVAGTAVIAATASTGNKKATVKTHKCCNGSHCNKGSVACY